MTCKGRLYKRSLPFFTIMLLVISKPAVIFMKCRQLCETADFNFLAVSSSTIKIVIADDHELFREGFKAMLNRVPEYEVIGEAANGEELLNVTEQLQPDIVIVDIIMPKMDGILATEKIKSRFPGIKVIAISMFDDDNSIMDMLEAGASGYLVKNAHKNDFLQALRKVYEGNMYYCNQTTLKLARLIADLHYHPHRKKLKTEFTSRQIEIIQLIGNGFASKEIAGKLKLTTRTIENYREKIMEKMDVNNTAGLIVYAIKHRLFKI